MKKLKFFYLLLISFLSILLVGCASTHHSRSSHYGVDGPPDFAIDIAKIPDAVPKEEPLSKYGNPKSYVAVGHRYYVMKSAAGYDEKGIASWYGMKFHKIRTSSGEPYSVAGMTAAHKTLPIPTYVQVTNLKTGKRVVVKVNDRGPFVSNRIIDLSYVAARKLGVTAHGTALVEVKAIDPRHWAGSQNELAKTESLKPVYAETKPRIYLQIGAFGKEENANALAAKVKQLTELSVLIKASSLHDQAIYRVQIGPIADVQHTDELSSKLVQAGLGKPLVVVT